MHTVNVSGTFLYESREPVEGVISFVPEKLWVVEGGVPMATLAPETTLVDGEFDVELSAVKYGSMTYYVASPVGEWVVQVMGRKALFLKNLLPKYANGI